MPNQYTGPKPRQAMRVIGPSIAYIPLTRGMMACVEVEDVHELTQYTWSKGCEKDRKRSLFVLHKDRRKN